MQNTTETKSSVKRPKQDMSDALTAIEENDVESINHIKGLYQVACGTNKTLIEEIKWHITQHYFKENPLK